MFPPPRFAYRTECWYFGVRLWSIIAFNNLTKESISDLTLVFFHKKMPHSLDKENKILLTCGRTILTQKQKTLLLELVRGDINWEHLIQLAAHHKLLPLLYRHLSTNCVDKVPLQLMILLKQFYKDNALQNLKKLSALVLIESRFRENKIKTLSVKGPVLTYLYYSDISLRSFCDIDILVSQENFQKATFILKKMGYTYIPENIPEKYFFKFAQISHHGQLVDKYGVKVEIHWELSGHYGAKLLDFQTLKPFITAYEIQGCTLTTLCPEMLLVYLALHAQRHYWQRYDYLVCIAEILHKKPTLNWHHIDDLAAMLKLSQVIYHAVFMAHKILGAPLNHDIISTTIFFDRFTKSTNRHSANWNLINQSIIKHNQTRKKWLVIYLLRLRLTDRFCDVIKQYKKQYFIPEISDWKLYPVPYTFNIIYYIIHPLNKLAIFLRRLFFGMQQNKK